MEHKMTGIVSQGQFPLSQTSVPAQLFTNRIPTILEDITREVRLKLEIWRENCISSGSDWYQVSNLMESEETIGPASPGVM